METAMQRQDPESRSDSKTNRDEIELAHFGKRQQLKVSHPDDPQCYPNLLNDLTNLFPLVAVEVFWSCVHHWTDVYLDGNMGRTVRVSHNIQCQ